MTAVITAKTKGVDGKNLGLELNTDNLELTVIAQDEERYPFYNLGKQDPFNKLCREKQEIIAKIVRENHYWYASRDMAEILVEQVIQVVMQIKKS